MILPVVVSGKLGHEFDLARVFMGGEPVFTKLAQIGLECVGADDLGTRAARRPSRSRCAPCRYADHADHGDGWMAHQAFLDLARADAVAAEVMTSSSRLLRRRAVLVDAAEIAGQQPVAGELPGRRLGIAPVLQHDDGIVPEARDLAVLAGRHRLPCRRSRPCGQAGAAARSPAAPRRLGQFGEHSGSSRSRRSPPDGGAEGVAAQSSSSSPSLRRRC